MPAFSYTAKRNLISGHSVDTVYDLDYLLLSLDRRPNTKKNAKKSFDGTIETILHYHKETISVSVRVDAAGVLQFREFMGSIAGGEAFIFDETGTVAVPVNGINCRVSGPHRERRVQKLNKYDCFFSFEVI